MSLARALTKLPSDRPTESVVRDVLVLFSHHQDEWLSIEEVARKTGNLQVEMRPVLEALHDGFVLDFDEPVTAFRYRYDIGVSIEIDTFVHRSHVVENHAQTNVARFRERYSAT